MGLIFPCKILSIVYRFEKWQETHIKMFLLGTYGKKSFLDKSCLMAKWQWVRRVAYLGWMRCKKNRKVPGSKLTRRSVVFRDLTSLWGSRWPLDPICKYVVINIGWGRLPLNNDLNLTLAVKNTYSSKKSS